MRRVLCAFPAALFLAGALAAQIGGSGTIQGTVSDPSGAVVAGVTDTATNVATGIKTERQTTGAGVFVLAPLAAGEYRVSVSAAGFQTLTTSDAPSENSQDARLGATVRNDVYSGLPLAMGTGGIGAGPRIHK